MRKDNNEKRKGFQISVRNLLLILSAVPLLFILSFSAAFINTEYKALRDINLLINSTEFSYQISEYVHEMQKERGATGGFIGSKGKEFGEILIDQRKLTDDKRHILDESIKIYSVADLSQELRKSYDDAFEVYGQLEDHRSRVDILDVSDEDSIGFYTRHNAKMYNFVSLITTLSEDAELNTIMSAYISFVEGKEKAGVERALMTDIFELGNFRDDTFRDFNFLVYSQTTYEEIFNRFATAEQIAFYSEISTNRAFSEVERIREIVFEHGASLPEAVDVEDESETIDGFGVDPEYWFRIITEKINLLHVVELELASDLTDRAQELKSQKERSLLLSIIVAIVAVISMFALTFVFAYLLSRPLTRLTSVINEISLGKLEACR